MQIPFSDWFAVRVKSRAEDAVSELLTYKGYTTYVPRSGGNGGQRLRCRQLLPGYVLCRSTGQSCGRVVTTPFVISLVAFAGSVALIPEADIEHLRVIEGSGFDARPWPEPPEGAPVRIIRGPLAGIQGSWLYSTGRNRFLVSITMLQRTVCVETDGQSIEFVSVPGDRAFKAAKPTCLWATGEAACATAALAFERRPSPASNYNGLNRKAEL
jgi:transcription termination/antitermination protein NusG